MAYDIRFLQYDSQVAAGWRSMFDDNDDVQMEPFTLSSSDAVNLRRLTETVNAVASPGQTSAIRRALFGPWIDAKIEIDLLQKGSVLLRRRPEISKLQLGALSIADGTRTAWPALVWTDRIEGHDMP